jgi:hypothetical protein
VGYDPSQGYLMKEKKNSTSTEIGTARDIFISREYQN